MYIIEIVNRWSRRSSLAIVDQVLFSGSHFLVNIMLARWLIPEAYGAFAIGLSLYIAFAGIVCSLTLEPMLIYGATDFCGQKKEYLARVFLVHGSISVLFAGVFLLFSLLASGVIQETLSCAAIALPIMLQAWFVRRAFYAQMQIEHAAVTSLLYAFILLIGIIGLRCADVLSPFNIYAIFILAGLFVLLYYSVSLRWLVCNHSEQVSPFRLIILKHWNYGKWLIIASMANSVSTLLYVPVLALLSQLGEAAAFRAIQNLSLPFTQMLIAFTLLLLPLTSRILRNEQKQVEAFRHVLKMTLAFSFAASLYGCVMVVFGGPILRFVYNNPYYVDYFWMIPVFAIVLVVAAANQSMAIAIRAYEETRTILMAKMGAALVVSFVFVAVVPLMKLKGVLIGMILGALVEFVILARFFWAKRLQIKEQCNE